MSFKEVLGHSKPIELLRRAIKGEKIAHSYLFLGNEGIGKKWTALQFAKALNCLEGGSENGDGCDHCISCKKIEDGLHPDIMVLEPENQTLKVDQVREMQRVLAFRPYEGKKRVCILAAADRMAPNMSNILLKTLEEPPLHTVIILIANSQRRMLPTIVSRCQLVRFTPLPIPLVSRWLSEQKGLKEEEAHLLASLSEGSPGKTLEIREEIGKIPREELLKNWVGLRRLSFERMEGWVESLPSQREDLLLFLDVAQTLLRDLVVVKILEEGSKLIHSDLWKEIQTLSSEWNLSSLLKRMDAIHQTTVALKSNANTGLALESMMLSWAEG
jgi:DNA polymerase III subunit delta'